MNAAPAAAAPSGAGRIAADDLAALVRRTALAAGFAAPDAETVTRVIVDSDIHGVHSHGVRLFANHLPQIADGRIRADARPELAVDRRVTGVVDGRDGYGPVVCSFAVDHVLARAAEFGMAAVAVRHSSHWGCPAHYARRGAEAGFVLIGATNTSAAMPLWGAAQRSVGNNPMVFGVPRADGDCWVLDMAMQRAAWGKLAVYRDEGRRLPGNWGYDTDLRPTDDPAAIIASGLIQPMGDHKGSGLAVMLEALTGGLAASEHALEIRQRLDAGQTQHKSQFFLALDPEAFGGRDGLERLVRSYASAVADLPPADGFDSVRLPGEGAAERRRAHLGDGIPLKPSVRLAIAAMERFMDARTG